MICIGCKTELPGEFAGFFYKSGGPFCSATCGVDSMAAYAARYRKLMDQAVYGGTCKGEHVWRFRPIMGPHANLHDAIDAIDAMGE